MAELPIMPLKTTSLLADTMHMTAEEFGVYCRLLFFMWGNGGKIVDDDSEMSAIGGVPIGKWRKIREKVLRPMTIIGGLVSQKRLTDTWINVQELRRKRALAADIRWNSKTDAKPMHMHSRSNATKTKTRIESSLTSTENEERSGSADDVPRLAASPELLATLRGRS